MASDTEKCQKDIYANIWIVVGILCFIIIIAYLWDLGGDVHRIMIEDTKKFFKI